LIYGRIWTGDSTRPWADAVATRGDTILIVGTRGDVDRLRGPNSQLLDNGGALVAPGFMDNHVHLLSGGFQLSSVNLRDAKTPEEFTRRLKAYASERQPGEWIVGGDWDHENWPGAPLPRKEWLDSVTPNNPVFVSRLDGHMGVANGLALKAAGITRATKEIPGGLIVRDSKTGEPTGLLKDEAMGPVYGVMPAPSAAQQDAALARATEYALSKGVTAVAFVSAGWAEVAAVLRAHRDGSLGIRVAIFPSFDGWRRVADSVAKNGPGDDWVRLAGVKGYMDGSLGSTTALFFEPYADDPSTTGLETTNRDSVAAWIGAADSAGLQVAIHAIGERANAVLLDIYDSVAKAHGPRDRRFRIEHAQHLRPAEVERIEAQGVIAAMHPFHIIDDGRWAGKRLGPRVVNSYVFRSLLDRGAHLNFGSDWNVAPIDPILGIYAAVTRRTLDDKNPGGWIPEQKITLEEALKAYTSSNAYGVYAEGARGMIRPGFRADLVLLEKDLFAIPPEEIATVQIRATIAGGKIGYQSSP
jgi:predicted amidohydrolase YtcJ